MQSEVLNLRHVTLSRNGEELLREFSLKIFRGDILGLVNIDYQGLSALQELLIFNRVLTSGSMFFMGEETSSAKSCRPRRNKVFVVESKSRLVHSLNLSENFFFIKERSPFFVKRKKQLSQLCPILKRYGLEFTGLEYPSELSALDRCKFELIKLSETGCRLVILKNLSSFLNSVEMEQVHALVKKLAAEKGTAFLYLSTHVSHFFGLCNKIAVMRGGSILYKKDADSVDPKSLRMILRGAMQDFAAPDKKSPSLKGESVAHISSAAGFAIDVQKGECLVLLDLDNTLLSEVASAFLNAGSESVRITILGRNAFENPTLFSYIPGNPLKTVLFPHMSCIDNLTIKKCACSSARFWLPHKFMESVKREFAPVLGRSLELQDLSGAAQEELYNVIYQKVRIERPKVVFINQPFDDLDMMQRLRNLEAIHKIQQEGCAVVILAISAAEYLKSADRVAVIQKGRISRLLSAENFDAYPFLN